ncbi:MAG: single hybrid motif-containing protein, partial [Olpidium bornovanus]
MRSTSPALPPNIVITMPALSPTMTQGNIGTWHKKIGDKVSAGDVLVEIETDKAQMDFECQDEGYLAKILAETGTKDVPINRPIAVFVDEAADIAKVADFVPEEAEGVAPVPSKSKPIADVKQETQKVEAPSFVATSSGPREASSRKIASPLAKVCFTIGRSALVLAAQKGININDVEGSGPNGRVIKADIEQFEPSSKAKSAKAAAPEVTAAYTDVPLTNMRKVIAQRLTQSKQEVPHYYLTVEIEMDKILKCVLFFARITWRLAFVLHALREVLNRDARNGAPKLSVNDFVVKASALALKA